MTDEWVMEHTGKSDTAYIIYIPETEHMVTVHKSLSDVTDQITAIIILNALNNHQTQQ